MSDADLCVVLLNHVNWRDTRECLESLARAERDLSVVVVDTGSPNDSVERLVEWVETGVDGRPPRAAGKAETATRTAWSGLPDAAPRRPRAVDVLPAAGCGAEARRLPPLAERLTILTSRRRLGFAAGCNAGLRLWQRHPGARYVWLLNNDAIAAPDAAGRLVAAADRLGPRLGALGTLIADYRRPDEIQILGGGRIARRSAETRFPAHGRPLTEAPDRAADLNGRGRLDYISGASLLTSLAAVRRVGPLDETMHLYWEDTDWCARTRAAGLHLAVCAEAVVWHKGQASTGGINHYTKFHHFRSATVYLRRHQRSWRTPLALRLAKSVARDLAAAKPRDAIACVRGLAAGLRLGRRPPRAEHDTIGRSFDPE